MKKIKIAALLLAAAMTVLYTAGCGAKNSDLITVISREEGSGTRGAFIELFGIEVKNESGEKTDCTTDNADITSTTSVMMTGVAGNPNAIGYISMGSLNDTVKALQIDGVSPTLENIKTGEYKIARPFNIATGENISEAAQIFIDFIMSAEGQKVIESSGYIPAAEDAAAFKGSTLAGKVTVAGSSSITPVMEKLKEAYLNINSNAEIDVQQCDSSSGINRLKDGICDIGMASRDLKESELSAGLTPTVIAMDGIAVIVSKENNVAGLTSEQVRAIFTGEITTWSGLE